MHDVVIKTPRRHGAGVATSRCRREADPDGDGMPDKPVPMVLDVHGGPWARDDWGFNAEHQWLANRGYAVLSVNYRGSTGFGKEFVNAANGEWAGKMHDDLLDAVELGRRAEDRRQGQGRASWAAATAATPRSSGLTFTPDVFACGVDIVGPSSLVTLLQNVPPYWAPVHARDEGPRRRRRHRGGPSEAARALAADAGRQDQASRCSSAKAPTTRASSSSRPTRSSRRCRRRRSR